MSQYTIKEARQIAISCASSYEKELRDKQFLIIYKDKSSDEFLFIEPVFLARNYQHLTGLLFIDEETGEIKEFQSCNFYRKCLKKKLGNAEIAFKDDGTTQLKLEALPAITRLTSITSMIGPANHKQPYLYVDKVAGGVNFCLGLEVDDIINEYVPVSALNEDIRKLTDSPSRVIAIFERKYESQETYTTIRHVAKGINLFKCAFPQEIVQKISLEKYVPRS